MITFSYTSLTTASTTVLTLLDSDRYWPAEWGHDAQGSLQVFQPPRGGSSQVFARGNVLVPIRFETQRVFTTLSTAWNHAFRDVPRACGLKGTLTIGIPGGGQVRSVGCGCEAAPSRCQGIRVFTAWRFIGPQLTS